MTEEKLPQKVNLLGFDAEGLKKFCEDLGEKPVQGFLQPVKVQAYSKV